MSIRDKTKHSLPDKGAVPGKYRDTIEAIKKRGFEDLLIREDCPCPAHNCPHKGNCLTCILYHHMLSVVRGQRMVLPACAYFSERDYWVEKRKSTTSPEVREAIDEWLAHYRDIHAHRMDMTQDPEMMAFDREFEDRVNRNWTDTYAGKTAEEREQRIKKNKRRDKGVPGAYPYK
ncbi:MAG: hypothetical protein JRL30_26090 [Deltaproteobacteria bacterium]|nr:hypothetical protein [Deltaproteobacteria bacterium]